MSELPVVDKRWTYCPECGSTEIRHAEGDHKQCACCLQEWFADIDYTDVVRTNLGNRMQLRSSLTARDAALLQAQRDLQDCHMAFLNNIKSPAAHDRYAGIAERGIEAIGAALSKEAPK